MGFGEYCRSLVKQLFLSYAIEDIESHVECESFSLGVDQAIPCGLILNELVSNALKHAFPGGRSGTVNVSVRAPENRCCVQVSDNGVGVPPGFDYRQCHTLGMQLVSTLTEQLNATLEFSGGAGVTVQVSFMRE